MAGTSVRVFAEDASELSCLWYKHYTVYVCGRLIVGALTEEKKTEHWVVMCCYEACVELVDVGEHRGFSYTDVAPAPWSNEVF